MLLFLPIFTIFFVPINGIPHERSKRLAPPKYLSVDGFQDCLVDYAETTSAHWCFPLNQPKSCSDQAWKELAGHYAPIFNELEPATPYHLDYEACFNKTNLVEYEYLCLPLFALPGCSDSSWNQLQQVFDQANCLKATEVMAKTSPIAHIEGHENCVRTQTNSIEMCVTMEADEPFCNAEIHGKILSHVFQPKATFYNATYPLTEAKSTANGLEYKIAVIADLDKKSKVTSSSGKNHWKSFLKMGTLTWDAEREAVSMDWNETLEIKSKYSYGGRGMELSELAVFNGHLYAVDDRTGIVFKLEEKSDKWIAIPWVILANGDGNESKGFKGGWMAVKDQHLYVGGSGKEWTTPDGEVIVNHDPMFVKKISMEGKVEHLDWHDKYIELRSKAGIEFPGYMIHEAATWSDLNQTWTFLPRKAHPEKYNDVDVEKQGTNLMFTTDYELKNIDLKTIGNLDQPTHGFSSFKFIPGTNDTVIVALKSEEVQGLTASYVMVFKTDGTILYPETKIGDCNYEGIEFI